MIGNLPASRRGPDNRTWHVVATVGSEAEAAIITGRLESAGIPVWVYRESAGAAIGLTMGLLGSVYVMTPESYYEEAMTLLEGGDSPELDDGAPELDDGDTIAPD